MTSSARRFLSGVISFLVLLKTVLHLRASQALQEYPKHRGAATERSFLRHSTKISRRHGSQHEKGARWEEIVDRWPFRKGVDHSRAPGLHLHCIWPRGKPGGPTRARWPGPSSQLANEDHWNTLTSSSELCALRAAICWLKHEVMEEEVSILQLNAFHFKPSRCRTRRGISRDRLAVRLVWRDNVAIESKIRGRSPVELLDDSIAHYSIMRRWHGNEEHRNGGVRC
jgi:hypothetical protein